MTSEALIGGPSITLPIGRYIQLGAQYSISRTLYDGSVNSFGNISCSYEHPRNGVRFILNASSPLQQPDQSSVNPIKYGYINLSLRKTLNIPLPFNRQYYNLKVRLFEDYNGNGTMDEAEQPIRNKPCMINDINFITDVNGYIRYKNIERADYHLDLSNIDTKGLIPGNGNEQVIHVAANSQMDVPFKKSKIIAGILIIIQDSTHENTFYPGGLKITARDTSGHTYVTTSGDDGRYFISLPAGSYEVSLNPEAFNNFYRPVKMSQIVSLITAEAAQADFTIKQHRREVKVLKMEKEVTGKASRDEPVKAGTVHFSEKEKEDIKKIYTELRERRGIIPAAPSKEVKIPELDLLEKQARKQDTLAVPGSPSAKHLVSQPGGITLAPARKKQQHFPQINKTKKDSGKAKFTTGR